MMRMAEEDGGGGGWRRMEEERSGEGVWASAADQHGRPARQTANEAAAEAADDTGDLAASDGSGSWDIVDHCP